MSIVEICYQFSSTKMDVQTVINWSVVGHLTIATWSTAIVYHSDSQALSTAWCRRAGPLPTADRPTCRRFNRAMGCIRGTSHGPVSVCLSVTSRDSTKTTKHRITQTTSHNSPWTLVFWCQRSPRNSTGVTPYGGTKCRWGGSKSATFDKLPAISRRW